MNYNFENFILTYDNMFDHAECQSFIDYFEKCDQLGFTVTRKNMGESSLNKSDNQLFVSSLLAQGQLDVSDLHPFYRFNDIFWEQIYPLYVDEYGAISNYAQHTIRFIKLQKTRVGEGYHVWHHEDDSPTNMRRILTFILYLNDVEEGGETEFLYYGKRVKSKAGRLVLWPAGFTHTHRGNPPLKDAKYILTGWVEMN